MITLSPEVAGAYPEAEIRLVVARGMVNSGWTVDLSAVENDFTPYDESGPEIGSWHEAFRRFGTNPRRTRPSVDALSRRLAKSGQLPRVNPAVDAYNLVSVRHGIPAGAFDLDRLPGPVTIRFAAVGDRFTPLGEPDAVEMPNPGEVVYASGSTVLTRHWNHRDADGTKVTDSTTGAVFILERVSSAVDGLPAAQAQLVALLAPHATTVEAAPVPATRP